MGAGVMNPIIVDAPPADGTMPILLSRYAECTIWLARYMERIENLARLIDVTETFVRSGSTVNGWQSIIQINADEERFFARHAVATEESVVGFYVTDRENPNSIASIAHAARENARALRPLISTEMWTQLNIFTNTVRALGTTDIRSSNLSALCARLKQECQTHHGITEGTFYRDQAWLFYLIGRNLERGDQITRLIDIKYHTLLPSVAGVGSEVDISQWTAVLRSAAAYHAFRRVVPGEMTPGTVAGFLLKNDGFPRSLSTCLRQLHWAVGHLRTDYGLKHGYAAAERIEELRATLAEQTVKDIILRGLHEFLDWVQRELRLVQGEIAQAFWPPMEPPPAPAPAQSQSQA
ncbi:alpha-E domain-containing protein [Gluconacetobacter azotocaptans]|uniref:Alpha-E domain-containing protein n=1 Tax=Gluconacetobacter azotocaptans TaxID=142834 RepID=A0A7W4PF68_9PROT|nr:alpha-E domain-containing protein [Gluconacetobacter azotocaptans]MBM9402454.1 alpha-E domain-containing protein [Gluconacetobacter azotocaptans]